MVERRLHFPHSYSPPTPHVRTGSTPCNCAPRRIFFFANPRLCTVIAMATRVIKETTRLFISVTVCGVEIAENVPPTANYESVNSHWYCEWLVDKHAVKVITFLFLCMTSSLQEARITATHTCTHSAVLQEPVGFFPREMQRPQICWETPPSLLTKENKTDQRSYSLLWCLCTLGRRRRPRDDSLNRS